ncbi:uncharacterized protein LOC133966921 [Platichthys flesus]|uniref:uncharacterized protein LOC133966921 n=1 Tax=Platichthys flesus TaxID=8260 RepID=UPI002DB6F7E6|nr:uncharacterized protein LOC133966921 [Platichthys flesus]
MGNEEQQEKLLREWLDCCVTDGGVLVALQKSSRRRNHPLVTQMVEKWLDGYRQIRPCVSLSDGEEEEEDEDEEKEEGKKDEGSSPDQHTAGPSVPLQSSTCSTPSVDLSKPLSPPGSPPCTSLSSSKAPPEPICVSSPPHPVEPPSDPGPRIDSQTFWKSCNAAGCTQAIFTDFINEMNDIAGRIQSDQASEDDCNHALNVMAASGKLEEIVAKQQKELQRKQQELMKAAAAMQQVFSALRR